MAIERRICAPVQMIASCCHRVFPSEYRAGSKERENLRNCHLDRSKFLFTPRTRFTNTITLNRVGIVARQATIDQRLRGRPIEVAKFAPLDGCGLTRVNHLVLKMARAELRAESVPQELQQL